MNPQQRPHGRRGRRAWAVAAILMLVGVLAACTSGRSGGNDDQRAGGAHPQPAQAPTSVRGDLVGLVLSGVSLTREGGGVTLRATITNQHPESVTIGDLLGPNGLEVPPTYDASGLYLYDGSAHKRYEVLRDGGSCRCSKVPLAVEPGQSLQVYATFADPARSDQLSAVVPHFAPLDGLQIKG
jgi:hypothetical protein